MTNKKGGMAYTMSEKINKLKNVYYGYTSKMDAVTTDYSEFQKNVKEELNQYAAIVYDFFVDKESDIKSIYAAIRSNYYPYNTINAVDVYDSVRMYSDYLQGMVQFMKKVIDLQDSDDINIEAIHKTIEQVKEKDCQFIMSIFGGERNPSKDQSIDFAMKNVELLIDINEEFADFLNIANDLITTLSRSNCTKYQDEIVYGLKVFFDSIRRYNYNCIKHILGTYEKIMISMKSRVPVTGIKEVPKYQIF